jgi:hypothetical protein
MISFDLKCAFGHVFEAWFRSSANYEDQRGGRLISCPTCGNADISKAVMAPAVAPKSNRRMTPAPAPEQPVAMTGQPPVDMDRLKVMLAEMAKAQTKMLEQSQWVGDKFADQARAMHYGEIDQLAIHGTVAPQEARAMIEEGVPVAPLIVPVVPPDNVH